MPYLKLNTNIELDRPAQSELARTLSQLLAAETRKPERYVMVEINAGKVMLFGGADAPLAYLECKSIGLTTLQAKALSTKLSEHLMATFGLPADRVYIEFSDCNPAFWGWNGSTFG